jgi:hypothetical protein
MEMLGVDFGQFVHLREPTTPDNQPVIRMNQDTLYSATVLDLSEPVEITLPEVGGRYMSMHVVNQDHHCFVESKPGTYELTEDEVGTRFALVTVRTFYNAGDPDDLAEAHAAQDKLEISGGGGGPFEAPNWDTEQLAVARQALSELGSSALIPLMPLAARKRSGRSTISSLLAPAGADCRAPPPSTSWKRGQERRQDAACSDGQRRARRCVLVHHGLQRRRVSRSERTWA